MGFVQEGTDTVSDQYAIVLAEIPLKIPATGIVVGEHHLLVLTDTTTDPTTGQPLVKVLGELDGLATNSSGGTDPFVLTPFGNTGDSLTAYF